MVLRVVFPAAVVAIVVAVAATSSESITLDDEQLSVRLFASNSASKLEFVQHPESMCTKASAVCAIILEGCFTLELVRESLFKGSLECVRVQLKFLPATQQQTCKYKF